MLTGAYSAGRFRSTGFPMMLRPPVLNRRRFLGLAALGGTALALPGHAFSQHLDGALAATFDADWWWGAFRELTLTALAAVPEVGGILSFFGGLFIPAHLFDSDDAQWRQYIEAVNRIVDEKLDDAIYLQVQASLAGFSRATRLFLSALETGDAQHIRSIIDALNVSFSASIAGFMLKGHEARLLPLFVPVANMHLGLLRQAVQQGRLRQFPPAVIVDYQNQLQASIVDYGQYYDDVVELQLQAAAKAHPHDAWEHRNEPLAAVYTLRSQLQGSLGDTRDCWPSFDTGLYPGEVKVHLDRELFSLLIGSYFDDSVAEPSRIVLPAPPTGPIRRITLQGYVFVDGLTVSYGPGQGPDGVDAVRVGGRGGAVFQHDDIVQRGHVRAVQVRNGYAVDTVALEYGDGSRSEQVGGDRGYPDPRPATRLAFPGHHLSSVIGFGTAAGYGGVLSGCMFGFQLDEPTAPVALDRQVRDRLQRVWPTGLHPALQDSPKG